MNTIGKNYICTWNENSSKTLTTWVPRMLLILKGSPLNNGLRERISSVVGWIPEPSLLKIFLHLLRSSLSSI